MKKSLFKIFGRILVLSTLLIVFVPFHTLAQKQQYSKKQVKKSAKKPMFTFLVSHTNNYHLEVRN